MTVDPDAFCYSIPKPGTLLDPGLALDLAKAWGRASVLVGGAPPEALPAFLDACAGILLGAEPPEESVVLAAFDDGRLRVLLASAWSGRLELRACVAELSPPKFGPWTLLEDAPDRAFWKAAARRIESAWSVSVSELRGFEPLTP